MVVTYNKHVTVRYIYNMHIIKVFIFIIFISSFFKLKAQSKTLANDYFEKGEFKKALVIYNKLLSNNAYNYDYFDKVVTIYQQLEDYDKADSLLVNKLANDRDPRYLIDLGYNYQLKKQNEIAENYYNKALAFLESNTAYTSILAKRFELYALIDFAIKTYEKSLSIKQEARYSIQLARLYGEQGDVEKMFVRYIEFLEKNENYVNQAKRVFTDFISEDGAYENNSLLRRTLLKKIQTSPNILWNRLLSWLFVQQNEYKKAFAQEKAIYKRFSENLEGVLELAEIAIAHNKLVVGAEALHYVIKYSQNESVLIKANLLLLEQDLKLATEEKFESIDKKYTNLIAQFAKNTRVLGIKLGYSHFKAFYQKDYKGASAFLKKTLKTRLSNTQTAKVKMKLADILVLQERFNEALIYYSQIQKSLKNSVLAQEARFKVAKTSYYKGDFKWAEAQLKILKSSTSQLIANDALDLKLLISDNKFEDSSQTALKTYAKADLAVFQNNDKAAIDLLSEVIKNHKTETIVDQALYFQAQLYEQTAAYDKAKLNYEFIIANFKNDILIDDAYYALANLYIDYFDNSEKAKTLLEKIIFNHPDSIYFVSARKKYRALRGDANIN